MLVVENLDVFYGKSHAVQQASFTVNPGEVVSLRSPTDPGPG